MRVRIAECLRLFSSLPHLDYLVIFKRETNTALQASVKNLGVYRKVNVPIVSLSYGSNKEKRTLHYKHV